MSRKQRFALRNRLPVMIKVLCLISNANT